MLTTPQIELGTLSMADSLILMVLALVVFGPRRLPQIGRQIGKLMYEFRKASNDFKFQMEEELRVSEEAERKKKEEAERQRVAAAAPPVLSAPTADGQAQSMTGEPPTFGVADAELTPVDASAAPEPDVIVLPRVSPVIQPPSTGEPIASARYGARRETAISNGQGDAAEEPVNQPAANVTAEANVGAEPPAIEPIPANPNPTEPLSHHG